MKRALAIRRKKMDACYVSTLLKLGEIYKAQRPVQHDKAIGAYEEALAALRLGVETGSRSDIAICHHNIAAIRIDQQSFATASCHLEAALDLYIEAQNLRCTNHILRGIEIVKRAIRR